MSQQDPKKLRQLIHVAKRDLHLDEPTYRTLLRVTGGVESTSDMGTPALMRVLDRLKRDGFVVRSKGSARTLDVRPESRKVRALWLFLHHLGAVKNPSEVALAAYVRRIAHVDDLRFAKGDRLLALIETLKKWAMRYLPAIVADLKGQVRALAHAGKLSQEQLQAAAAASDRLAGAIGFDAHWLAWETFTEIVGLPIAPELRDGMREGR